MAAVVPLFPHPMLHLAVEEQTTPEAWKKLKFEAFGKSAFKAVTARMDALVESGRVDMGPKGLTTVEIAALPVIDEHAAEAFRQTKFALQQVPVLLPTNANMIEEHFQPQPAVNHQGG